MAIAGVDTSHKVHALLTDGSGRLYAVTRWYTSIRRYVALGTTNETTIWDPTAGTKFVVTDIHVSATAAGTCTIRDGTAGATIWVASLAANGGFITNLQTPIQSTVADNILTAQASAITQYVLVTGYEI